MSNEALATALAYSSIASIAAHSAHIAYGPGQHEVVVARRWSHEGCVKGCAQKGVPYFAAPQRVTCTTGDRHPPVRGDRVCDEHGSGTAPRGPADAGCGARQPVRDCVGGQAVGQDLGLLACAAIDPWAPQEDQTPQAVVPSSNRQGGSMSHYTAGTQAAAAAPA